MKNALQKGKRRAESGAGGTQDEGRKLLNAVVGGARNVEAAVREEGRLARRQVDKLRPSRGLVVGNIIVSIISVVGVVATGFGVFLANSTLEATNLANTAYSLTSSFKTMRAACADVQYTPLSSALTSRTDALLTNNGRQPITVVRVWDNEPSEDRFGWVRVEEVAEGTADPHWDAPFTLEVGQAVLLRVFSAERVTGPLVALTSDGEQTELTMGGGKFEDAPALARQLEMFATCPDELDIEIPTGG